MYPHRIRLHGPWQYEPLARTVVHPDGRAEEMPGPVPKPGEMKIPASWRGTPLDEFRGRVRWRRSFHAPRSLERDERLWIMFDGVDYFADVSLNGTPLGRHEGFFEPFEFEITSLVSPRNELIVDVDCPYEAVPGKQRLIRGSRGASGTTSDAGIWQDVALEVRSVAFLRDTLVQTEVEGTTGRVTVTGKVVGEPDVPLGLDLSIDSQRTVSWKLEASAAGVDFRIEATIDDPELWWLHGLGRARTYSAELELHGKARTLDAVQRLVGFRRLAFASDLVTAELNGRRTPVTRTNGEILAATEYDASDRQGQIFVQGFPLSGGYSTDAALRTEAVRQAAVMVRRLAHHPSIAAWSCHSDPSDHDRELDDSVRAAITQLDPSRDCF